MDRLLTGRRIINSENHLRELWPFLTKKLAKSCYFDFYVPITPKPEICRRHFSLAAAEKGGWAQVACPSGLRQALTTPKCSSAGTMSIEVHCQMYLPSPVTSNCRAPYHFPENNK